MLSTVVVSNCLNVKNWVSTPSGRIELFAHAPLSTNRIEKTQTVRTAKVKLGHNSNIQSKPASIVPPQRPPPGLVYVPPLGRRPAPCKAPAGARV
jgi:hypothetical protein